MKLTKNFLKLPFEFDIEELEKEFYSLPKESWATHPNDFEGNFSIRLISPFGKDTDSTLGPMQATKWLKNLPYIQTIMEYISKNLNVIIGRSRFMILEGNSEASLHNDVSYYWSKHTRLHIPVITNKKVFMQVKDELQHFKEGECWTLDTWYTHGAFNNSDSTRVHLVIDVVPSKKLFNYTSNKGKYFCKIKDLNEEILFDIETNFSSKIIHYEELRNCIQNLLENIVFKNKTQSDELFLIFDDYIEKWRNAYLNVGEKREFIELYKNLNTQINNILLNRFSDIILDNNVSLFKVFKVFSKSFVNEELYKFNNESIKSYFYNGLKTNQYLEEYFQNVVFIVSSPRSGSTLLFELLSKSQNIYTIGKEGHKEIESISQLNVLNKGSNRLTEDDFNDSVKQQLLNNYLQKLINNEWKKVTKVKEIENKYFLEKTPKNSLRIPFLLKIFPNAKFIYLKRNSLENINSIYEGWKSNRFVTYKNLPNTNLNQTWSFVLPPNWENYLEKNLIEIAKYQFDITNEYIKKDLLEFKAPYIEVNYQELIDSPQNVVNEIFDFLNLDIDESIQDAIKYNLPLSKHTLTPPQKNKWKNNALELLKVLKNNQILNDYLNLKENKI